MANLTNATFQLAPISDVGNLNKDTFVLDANTHQIAFMFQVKTTEDIARVGFNVNSVVSPPVYKVSIQGSNAASNRTPNGMIKGGGSPASKTFTPDAGWQWIPLDNVYAATIGELLAIVIEYESGTIGASNDATWWIQIGTAAFLTDYPVGMQSTNTGSTWTDAGSGHPIFAFGNTTTVFGNPAKNATVNNPTMTTTGNRLAQKFTLPSGMGDTFKLAGLFDFNGQEILGDDIKLGVWNAAGTELAAISFDAREMNLSSGKLTPILFDSLATLNFGTAYYIGNENLAGSSQVYQNNWEVDAAADMDAFPLGQNCFLSEWNGSAWSDTTTKRLFIDLIFNDITEPVGGGAPFFVRSSNTLLTR